MRFSDPPTIRLADYRPPDYLIERVDMLVSLDPTRTMIDVTSIVLPNPVVSDRGALLLDGDELTLLSISIDGRELSKEAYTVGEDGLTLHDPPDRPFQLHIRTVLNPSANTRLMGLYRSNGVYCTQCEADGFRRISYFLDRPDVMARYRVRLEADRSEAPVLLANGNRIDAGDLADGRHYAVWDDPHPKPCYLFAIVGGDLGGVHDRFVTRDGRDVALGVYVEKGKEPFAGYAMDALKRSMAWDEQVYGLVYDLDVFNIVAVSDFNMGAMENKGLNIFNDKYILASPETATDTDYAQIEAVIAHEYFHNWTGNRITCRDWFQLCLKEGLTVYRDQEFSADMRSRAVKRIADVRELRARQFVEDAGPLAHPVRPPAYREINNFYTATVYEKGAELIRMLRLIVGDAGFAEGMRLYFDRHDGDAATVEQFIACFADVTGRDLSRFFLWYKQAGTPTLTMRRVYRESDRSLHIRFAQATPPTPQEAEKQPLVIPISFGFVGVDKAPTLAGEGVVAPDLLILDRAEMDIVVHGVSADTVPSVLRGFSAPVNLTADYSEAELLLLAEKDSDTFNRWQALEMLAMRMLKRGARDEAWRPSGDDQVGLLARAFGRFLAGDFPDPAFAALVLALPSELDVAREIATDVDPDTIFHARRRLKRALARDNVQAALSTYRHLWRPEAPYAPDAASAGRRALSNMALDLMITADPEGTNAIALAQTERASNMTDRFAALTSLVLSGAPARDAALLAFEKRFSEAPLVMDKWFRLQAAIPETETLARLRKLMSHPVFSLSNPNRALALIGGFAMQNPTQFNRADGAGFAFVAETALELDRTNPQVAARLMTAFRSWRSLEAGRRERARLVLESIASERRLSRDLSDIVERSLA